MNGSEKKESTFTVISDSQGLRWASGCSDHTTPQVCPGPITSLIQVGRTVCKFSRYKVESFKRNFYFGKEVKRKNPVSIQVSYPNGIVTDQLGKEGLP